MSEHIQSHNADGVLTLTLARGDKKNAMTDAMYGALADALTAAERDMAGPALQALVQVLSEPQAAASKTAREAIAA